jgi:ABC-type amino acid transport substrate-binding protein
MILMRTLPTLVALAVLTLAQVASAQTLRVGVPADPPYAIHDPSGVTSGMAVELLTLAAQVAEIDLELRPIDGDPLEALAEHDLILPVSATVAREAGGDLSLPLHTATLGVAREGGGLWQTVTGVLNLDFLRIVAGVSALLLFVGALVWLLERRKNPEMFHERPLRGLGDGFWWAGVTLTTIGYGDKAPATLPGRAVAMLWMLMGLAVSASLTATIVSATGVGRAAPDLPEALRGERVVVVEGGQAARFAEGRGLDLMVVPDMEAAVTAVSAGLADLALGAAPALRHADGAVGTGLDVTTTDWEPILKVALLPEGSEATELLDRALLTVLGSAAGQKVVRRWLGE